MTLRKDSSFFSRGLGKVLAIRKHREEPPNERKSNGPDQKFDDILEHSIEVGKVLSSVASVTPLPWTSIAADAVVKVLEFVKVRSIAAILMILWLLTTMAQQAHTNRQDLRLLGDTVVDFIKKVDEISKRTSSLADSGLKEECMSIVE